MKAFHLFNMFVALAMVMALVMTVQPAAAQEAGGEITRDSLYVPGEVIVGFTSGRAMQQYAAEADALAVEMGGQVVDRYAGMALLSFAEEADVPALAEGLGRGAGVAYAEPNYISWIPEQHPLGEAHELTEVVRRMPDGKSMTISMQALREMRTLKKVGRRAQVVSTYPNDPGDMWGWWEINANIIWPNTAASPTVCVVDTGIDTKHPDFAGQALNGKDFVNDDAIAEDDNGHGTHVAGTISAKMNNGKGLAGVSNGKVLAVKVLSAQGWGTAFDIASGIIFCADQTAVKVINMSLGGNQPSKAEYNALDYAVNTKGKFVAAAAGNDGKSHYWVDLNKDYFETPDEIFYFYPAAWASPAICRDGLLGPAGWHGECDSSQGMNENKIDPGLISVGAGRTPKSQTQTDNEDFLVWVDKNGDGVEPANPAEPQYWNEHMWANWCATDFTNYGKWVLLVAPGEGINSTVPVSYPFWLQAYEGVDEDQDGYEWLNGTSQATPHAAGAAARVWSINPGVANSWIKDRLYSHSWELTFAKDPNVVDPSVGYADIGYKGEAPFCWPDDTYTDEQDMTNSGYLDVANAMDRGVIAGGIMDAVSSLPLNGATVTAVLGTTTKATATINSKYFGRFDLINLPASYTYTVKVNKTGYTLGAQAIDGGSGVYVDAGYYNWNPYMNVGVPPSTRLAGVVNWGWPWDDFTSDLDLFVWLPVSSPGGGGVVGPWDLGRSDWRGEGDLSDFPRARWNRDGGAGDWMGLESISIVPRTGFTTYPYYNVTGGDYYDFILVDYAYGDDLNYNQPVFRMWVGGKIIGTVIKTDGCGLNEDSWYAGYMNLNTFTGVDDCGKSAITPGGVWPYDNP